MLGTEELYDDGALTFEVTVDDSGEISYDSEDESVSGAAPAATTSHPECNQSAYETNDLKEYGTWNYWVGDGAYPAAATLTQFANVTQRGVSHVVNAYTNCSTRVTNGAKASFKGDTTYEGDFVTSDGATGCAGGASTDGVSTVDAGNLDKHGSPPVAKTCWWTVPMPGVKNDLIEADIRFNTANFDFTLNGDGSCSRKKDLESVMTHQVGHVFGLAHVSQTDYPWMTMSVTVADCDNSQRTLGLGDMKGLASIY